MALVPAFVADPRDRVSGGAPQKRWCDTISSAGYRPGPTARLGQGYRQNLPGGGHAAVLPVHLDARPRNDISKKTRRYATFRMAPSR